MLPGSLPWEYSDVSKVYKYATKIWATWFAEWFDTTHIATITETPTHFWWESWQWIKLPYSGPHARGEKNESILYLPEWYGPVTVISIGLFVLDAIARNLPEKATEKYSLFQRVWWLYAITWGEWAWHFHFPNTSNGEELYILSPNEEGVNPYDLTD